MKYVKHQWNASSQDPFVICPYYTGRDKGPIIGERKGERGILTFFNEGRAWAYIFAVVQPDDVRACDNYRVIKVSQFEAEQR